MPRQRRDAAALLLAAILVTPSALPAQQPGLTRGEVEQTVRAYLLEHPEILLEMSQTLREREAASRRDQARTAIEAQRGELLEDPATPALGAAADAEGAVTVVAFLDYRCGYCKRVDPVLRKILEDDPEVRVIFKEFPILGAESSSAALAALAAHRQGRYEPFHQALMSASDLSLPALDRMAAEAGLDVELFRRDMAAPDLRAGIARNHALGAALAIEATPAFVIGEEVTPGALDEAAFRERIAKAREQTGLRAGN